MKHHLDFLNNGEALLAQGVWTYQGQVMGALSAQAQELAQSLWASPFDAQTEREILDLCEAIKPFTAHWMDEPFSLRASWEAKEVMQVPRSSVQHMGILAFGVHANGYVMQDGEPHMWVAKRALDKPTFSGQWDNMVGGGLTAGYSPDEILDKETEEEAGITVEQCMTRQFVGSLHYAHAHKQAVRRDQIFVYDLELPNGLEPAPNDGEVECFELWDMDRLTLELSRDIGHFKYNSAVLAIDFMHRHGQLNPQRCAQLAEVEAELRQRFERA